MFIWHLLSKSQQKSCLEILPKHIWRLWSFLYCSHRTFRILKHSLPVPLWLQPCCSLRHLDDWKSISFSRILHGGFLNVRYFNCSLITQTALSLRNEFESYTNTTVYYYYLFGLKNYLIIMYLCNYSMKKNHFTTPT